MKKTKHTNELGITLCDTENFIVKEFKNLMLISEECKWVDNGTTFAFVAHMYDTKLFGRNNVQADIINRFLTNDCDNGMMSCIVCLEVRVINFII